MKSENQMSAQTCPKKNIQFDILRITGSILSKSIIIRRSKNRQQKRPEDNFRSFWLPKQDSNLRHFG